MSERATTTKFAGGAGQPGWEPYLDRGLLARLGRRPTVIPTALGRRIWRRVEYFSMRAGALTRSLLDRGMPAARSGDDAPVVYVQWREGPEPSGSSRPEVSPARGASPRSAMIVVKADAVKAEVAAEAARHAVAESALSPAIADGRSRPPAVAAMADLPGMAPSKAVPDVAASAARPDGGRGDLPSMGSSASGRAPASTGPTEDDATVELVMPPAQRRTRRVAPDHSAPVAHAGGVSPDAEADIHPGPGALPDPMGMVELSVPAVRRNDSPALVVASAGAERPEYGRTRVLPPIGGRSSARLPTPAPVAAVVREGSRNAQDGTPSIVRSEDNRDVRAAVAPAASGGWTTPTFVPLPVDALEGDGATGPRMPLGTASVLPSRIPIDAEINRQRAVAPVPPERTAGKRPAHHSPLDTEGARRPALPHAGWGRSLSSGPGPDTSFDAPQAGPQCAGARANAPTGLPAPDSLQLPALSTSTHAPREEASLRPAWHALVDIDRLVRQVERRITKRLAVDAERKGGWS